MLVERDFQAGLRYVAVSRVKTLQGWMLDAPFDRNLLTYNSSSENIKTTMGGPKGFDVGRF